MAIHRKRQETSFPIGTKTQTDQHQAQGMTGAYLCKKCINTWRFAYVSNYLFSPGNAVKCGYRDVGMDNSITQIKQNCIEAMWPDVEAEKCLFNLLSLINNRDGNTCNTFGRNILSKYSNFCSRIDSKSEISNSAQLAAISIKKGLRS